MRALEPLGHDAIRFRDLGDLREHIAFLVCLGCLQLLGALLHRASFLFRKSLVRSARGGVLGGFFFVPGIAGFLPCKS
jgi:hypothetical protein